MVAIQTLAPKEKISTFCKRWKVVELSVFGSTVRDDFSPTSDIDILVTFAPFSERGLFDHVQMTKELKELFSRDVDLVTRRALDQSRNSLLRSEILSTAKILYSEGEAEHVQAS
jgi:predicted nucleotidyltransferase